MRLAVERIRRAVGLRIAGVKNAASTIPENFRRWFEPTNIFARLVNTTLASNETIFGTISKLANSMGSLPLGLYDGEYRRASTAAGDALIYEPNANMHRFEFIRTLETMRDATGNGYAAIDYDRFFQPIAYRPLDPSKVTPVIEKDSRELWYKVDGDQGTYYIHNMHVIHVKHISGVGGTAGSAYAGVSPLDVLRNTIDFDQKVKEFTLEDLETSVRASFILNIATMVDDERKKSVLDAFKNFYAENGGVLLEEQGTKITPIEKKLALDPKVFEVEKITRSRVAEVFGLPDRTEKDSYNTREQKALEYVQDTMVPIVSQYEAEFDRKLLTPDQRKQGLHFKFNVTALLRADMQTRMEFMFKGVRTAIFKPNECRAWEELPPEPGGDVLYMSRDLSPVQPTKQPV